MTQRLWIFGDSYGCYMEGHPLHQSPPPIRLEHLSDIPVWPGVLAHRLGLDYSNYSASGSAIEYSHWQWHQHKDEFAKGDLVVLVLTNPNRVWVDRDDVGNTDVSMWIDQLGEKEFRKIINLFDPDIKSVTVGSWLGYAALHAQQRGYRVLAIPCFQESWNLLKAFSREFDDKIDNFVWADFYLYEISQWELSHEWTNKNICSLTAGDIRNGHLSFTNHQRLVDVLIDALNQGHTRYSIDVQKTFAGRILGREQLDDAEFLTRELGSWYRENLAQISLWKRF